MNQKSLGLLLVLLVLLGGIYFAVQSSDSGGNRSTSVGLFNDLQAEQIAKIRIEQGKDVAELELKDGIWSVPAKAGYRADYGKIRSLVVKLLDLNLNQRITDVEANFERLSDKAVENGRGKIKLLDVNGKELAGLYLGELRKKKAEQGMAPPSGQYVRRTDQNQVYLMAEPITPVASLISWLDTAVLNLLSSRVESIQQFSIVPTEEKLEFELVRAGVPSEGSPAKFLMKEALAADEKLKDVADTQVPSGLENLTFADVFRADDPALKEVVFDKKTIYRGTNGLRYSASTAEKGDKSYLKLDVSYDAELAEMLKKRSEAASAIASAATTSDASLTSAALSSATVSSAAAKISEPLATAEEAQKLSLQLANWVFEVRKFQSQKLRFNRDGVVEKVQASGK